MTNFIKDWTNHEIEKLTKSFRRYSRFVFGMKFLLPVAIIGMIAALFIYPHLYGNKEKKIVLVAQPQSAVSSKEKPEMQNPRFHGMDSKNQPYSITAKRAVQEQEGLIIMEEVNADLTMNNGDFVGLVADSGSYDMKNQYVKLFGDIEIFVTGNDTKSYEMHAKDTDIDVKNQIITSDSDVQVRSSMGNFSATSFVYNKSDNRIIFKGPVKLVILRE